MKVKKAVVGCERYREEVSKYDWDVRMMMAIMEAESHCKKDNAGDNYPINGLLAPSCGLLQIRTLEGRPNCKQLKNPHTNIKWGYKIFKSQTYTAWTMYQNGEYLKYLK